MLKVAELKELSVEELEEKVNSLKKDLMQLRFQHKTGKLELITCCATHGFLPLMIDQAPKAARVQIEQGAREFARHFGERPKGIWLAECGYAEGVDQLLADSGIKYFFVDTLKYL